MTTELRIVSEGHAEIIMRVARQLRRIRWEQSGVSHEMSDSLPLLPTDFGAARTAIEAMREPTEAMLRAADRIIGRDVGLPIWRAMIGEALR
jgi:hypothetical protein